MTAIVGNNINVTFTDQSNLTNPAGPVYGPQSFVIGNADTTVIPDVNTLTLAVDAASGGGESNNSFTFASNTITAGNGVDTLYGTMYSLVIEVSGAGPFNGVTLKASTFTFDSNTITAGNGNGDALYGTMHNFTISAAPQVPSGGGGIIGLFFGDSTPSTYTFDGNTLTVGNGNNDLLFGAIQTFAIDVSTTGVFGSIGGSGVANVVTFDANHLVAGNGAGDKLYGTMQFMDFTYESQGGITSAVGVNGTVNTFDFKGNTLTAGNGAGDSLYGTLESFDNEFLPIGSFGNFLGTNDNPSVANIFTFGSNTLKVGNGNNDSLYGSMHDFTLNETNGSTIVDNELVSLGNTLIAGNGADSLYGSMQSFNVTVLDSTFGVFNTTIFPSLPTGNEISLGGNSLSAGSGADHLYGTMQFLDLSVVGAGDLTSTIADVLNGSGLTTTIGGTGSTGGNTFTFGGNDLHAGSGVDALYGSVEDMTLACSGRLNEIGGIGGGFNSFTFGDNTVIAGNGNGDQLYGTMHDLTLSATNAGTVGDVIGSGGLNYNLIQFGNNTVTAGNGVGDLLVGSMHDLIINNDGALVNGIASTIAGNIINFGTNVLNAGSGGDTLIGELNHIDLFGSATIDDFLANNTVNPGMNTFNLGKGVDTVVLDPAIDMGTNVINNWQTQDVLQFNNVIGDFSTVESMINSIASDGHGGTKLTFNAVDAHPDGGTIDFTNVAYHGETINAWLAAHVPNHVVHP
jgi:hypothetical protein